MTSAEYQQLIDFLGSQFVRIDGRFEAIDGQLGELRRDVLGHFDELYRRLERLEQEYQAIVQALRRIEAALADELGRREILERDLAALKLQLAALQSRIEVIEQRLGR
jgi:chromosome segregation ATPase